MKKITLNIMATIIIISLLSASSLGISLNLENSSSSDSLFDEADDVDYWGLLIAVGIYADHPDQNIPSMLTGVEDLNESLHESKYWKDENIKIITAEDATKTNIIEGFSWLDQMEDENDVSFVYITTHGGNLSYKIGGIEIPIDLWPFDEWDRRDETLATYNGFNNPRENLRDDELNILLNRLESQGVCLVVDSCHAGGFNDSFKNRVKSRIPSIFKPLKPSKRWIEEFGQELNRKGRVVIMSSREDEVSEGNRFTNYLNKGLDGLADLDFNGMVEAEELFSYIEPHFPDPNSWYKQHPTIYDGYPGNLTISPLSAGAQEAEWHKVFGGEYYDYGKSVEQTSDGGYIITGELDNFHHGTEGDVWLIKTDSNGNELWNRSFGGIYEDSGEEVHQTDDGGYIIVGIKNQDGSMNNDVFLIKTNSEGNEEWSKTFGGSQSDNGHSVQQTPDGGYVIGGQTYSYGAGYSDVWLIKTDSNGNEEWSKTFGGSENDMARTVIQLPSGGYILGGITRSNIPSDNNIWLIKTDSNGNEEWNKTYGGLNYCSAYSLDYTNDNGFIITGFISIQSEDIVDLYLLKTDSNGNMEWNKTYGGDEFDYGTSVKQTSDGGYIITGGSYSFMDDDLEIWLIKVDNTGNKEWEKVFGGPKHDEGTSVKQTTDGGYIITGRKSIAQDSASQLWLIKVAP